METKLGQTGDSSPYDTHTLNTHRMTTGRLYFDSHGGYFEIFDHGETQARKLLGLDIVIYWAWQ